MASRLSASRIIIAFGQPKSSFRPRPTRESLSFPALRRSPRKASTSWCCSIPQPSVNAVQGRIHACGIHSEDALSPLGDLGAHDLLERAPGWPAQIIAAHIASTGGLFRALQAGQARSTIWRHTGLRACSIPGPISDTPDDVRTILLNKNPDYEPDRPAAVLNCQDVKDPADLAKPGTTCFVKMTTPTIEGLRQAFLDSDFRIRLWSDPAPEEHIEFLTMSWETEGFLRGCTLHFNENLNVLIGGRGSGKSTVIESLRYVLGLEPIGDEARRMHAGNRARRPAERHQDIAHGAVISSGQAHLYDRTNRARPAPGDRRDGETCWQ